MWLGERITDKGIGNGISLLIMIGIIATFPQALIQEFVHPDSTIYFFLVEIAFFLIVIGVSVALVQAIRKVPVQMAKLQQGDGMMPSGAGARSFIPLKRQNSFIPGVKPGRPTAEFLDVVLSRITLPGAVFLGLVAILPAIVFRLGLTNSQSFAIFFGGTSLLIMVGVILDTLQQVESYLLSRHYDGLMKSGKMRNRTQSPVSGLGG